MRISKMDENEFFREATLCICGNLEIEEALFSCFHFLKQTIPVDRLLLQLYESGLGAVRTIAIATASECNSWFKTFGSIDYAYASMVQRQTNRQRGYNCQGKR
jgi:hypothetical protein